MIFYKFMNQFLFEQAHSKMYSIELEIRTLLDQTVIACPCSRVSTEYSLHTLIEEHRFQCGLLLFHYVQ